MKDLVVLRTNIHSSYWELNLKSLGDKYHVIVVADERKGNVGFEQFKKIQFTSDNVMNIGLSVDEDMYWRCGDYALYLADSLGLEYRYLWLVEPDVYLNGIEFEDFMNKYLDNGEDFLTSYYNTASQEWPWYKYGKVISEGPVYQSFFPLVRFTKQLIVYLQSERKKLKEKINDECFVANIIVGKKFTINEFYNCSEIKYDRNSFSFRLPHYVNFIYKKKYDLYHPVMFSLKDFFCHMYNKRSFKRVIKSIFIKNNKD